MIKYSMIVCMLINACVTGMVRDCAQIKYRKATIDDIDAIAVLYSEIERSPDADKLVILPRRFRAEKLISVIEKERLFVAYDGGRLIGMQKLYVIPQDELDDTLKQELRCTDTLDETACYLYIGGAYTHPDYRHTGDRNPGFSVNNALVQYAYQFCKTCDARCILTFGTTADNIKRKDTNVQEFEKYLQGLRGQKPSFIIKRYPAIKPTFDPEATKCVPLPDEQGIKGFGYVIEEQQ